MALIWAYLVAKVDTGTNKMLENLSAKAVELRLGFALEGERLLGGVRSCYCC